MENKKMDIKDLKNKNKSNIKDDVVQEDYSYDEENYYINETGEKKRNLPKKSKYRMRAHCNPLAEISIEQYT
jgi:hypothetical protein